ncbi:hypothetical protein QTG54_017080 [Skeletonema marinoi]|uniref:Uncharacterized protein n=1 Tax=Skeletonema marinoi TaxID=267567 RepID=A0AAD8XRL1_9STRA|nr:hypothetical protein QTG54_017080 [Skeletonema marinoi]
MSGNNLVGEAVVENDLLDDLSSEPDYDYLAEEHNMSLEEQNNNNNDADYDSMPSTPDYDNLGADCEEEQSRGQQQYNNNDLLVAQTISMSAFPAIPSTNDFDNMDHKNIKTIVME